MQESSRALSTIENVENLYCNTDRLLEQQQYISHSDKLFKSHSKFTFTNKFSSPLQNRHRHQPYFDHLQPTVKSSKLEDQDDDDDDFDNCTSFNQRRLAFPHRRKTNYFEHRQDKQHKSHKMSQDCGSACAKYILCAFNFIFFVSYNFAPPTRFSVF